MQQESSSAAVPVDPGVEPSPRKPRRLLRRVLVGIAFAGAVTLIVGPPLAAGWLRGEIVRRGNEQLNGSLSLERVELALNGKAKLIGLLVEDAQGRRVATLPEVRLDVGIRSILTGKKDVALHADGATFELVRDGEGRWNFSDLVKAPEDDEAGDGDPPGPPPQEPFDVHGRIEFQNCALLLRSPETALEVRDVHFTIGLDGKVKETAVELDATLFGGDGSAGELRSHLSIWPGAGPGLRIDQCAVTGLKLGAVQEALRLIGSPLEEGSVLEGTVDVSLTGRIADLLAGAPFALEVNGCGHDLMIDMRSGGLQTFEFEDRETTLTASLERAAPAGPPRATAKLEGRDGRLGADFTWDGAVAPGLVVDVRVDGIAASAGLEPLLARVHPVFAGASAFDGAAVDALVTSQIAITYDAPLTLDELAGGWDALPKEPFRGIGSLGVDEGIVRTSPFFAQLLQAFGEPDQPSFDLGSLGFAVDAGRLRYTDPWTWSIDGTETRFMGSVGLDRSLDLRWAVPVTGGLAKQNRVFERLTGRTFEVALGGTLTSPRFDLAGALSTLAKEAGQDLIRSEFDKQKEKLLESVGADDARRAIDEILDGGDAKGAVENAARKLLGSGAGAADLLKEADRLWDAGDKVEAGKLYTRIRNDFPLSPTYLLNKSRVKSRRNG